MYTLNNSHLLVVVKLKILREQQNPLKTINLSRFKIKRLPNKSR